MVADAVLDWMRDDANLGPRALQKKLQEKYHIKVPYMRVYYGKEMALDNLQGKWVESFHLLYSFKAELEKISPGSVVHIDFETVTGKARAVKGKKYKGKDKKCFRRCFVSLKPCWKGFLEGCRPYLAVDSTALTGKFRGQLAAASAIDGHNWLYLVAYGVLEGESTESWTWFMDRLHEVIGNPPGLVIHTDAGKGLEHAVDKVFEGVEHRECMRHLATNFMKNFKGPLFDQNLWPAAYTYLPCMHAAYMEMICSKPKVKKYLDEHHSKIWSRSKFSEASKVDYVNNNLAESFNSKFRKLKGLPIVDILDGIRQNIMEKFDLRQRIAVTKFVGNKILPSVIKTLNAKTRGLKLRHIRSSSSEAEVYAIDKDGIEIRYPVDVQKRTCACRQWQVTGLPCVHALYFITSLRGLGSEIEAFVDDYYSVDKFKAAYAENIPPMLGKHQWDKVDPGFRLEPPLLKRPPGRPRKHRIKASHEAGARLGLGARKRKCKRCGQLGHIKRNCKNTVQLEDELEDELEVEAQEESQNDLAIVVAREETEQNAISVVASSARKGAKKYTTSKKVTKRKRSENNTTGSNQLSEANVFVTPSTASVATSPQSMKLIPAVQPDSPASNTRSKKKLPL